MRNEREEDAHGYQNGGDEDTRYNSQGRSPVPPPEAFKQIRRFDGPQDQKNEDQNKKSNIRSSNTTESNNGEKVCDNNEPNPLESTITSAASSKGVSSPVRLPLLIRRESSLFRQLPIRSKSRLFDDIVSQNAYDKKKSHSDNAIDKNSVPETNISVMKCSHSQPTWLQDEHQSTLIGEQSLISFPSHSKSLSRSDNPKPCDREEEGRSSFFGTVMRQFGSGISNALPVPPSSPFGRTKGRSDSVAEKSPQQVGNGDIGGSLRSLMASPSGKTIMNIVNQFNSPFKFQSPSSSNKKRQRRRRLWGNDNEGSDTDDNKKIEATDVFATPNKRRRMQINDEDDNSRPSSNILFPDNDTNDSQSSLGGCLIDENWREAPIGDADGTIGARMELLDWSLATKARIEVHGGNSGQQTARPIADTWIRDTMRDNDDAFMYWIHQPPMILDGHTGARESSGLLAQDNNTSQLTVLQKSIATSKTSSSRQGSFNTVFDTKLENRKKINGKKNGTRSELPGSTTRLAKYLTQSVRGPHAKYSRNQFLKLNSWCDDQIAFTPNALSEHMKERSQRQWQEALRSLFSKYRRHILLNKSTRDSIKAMISDTYFYSIGQDHSVLFRVAAGSRWKSDDNDISKIDKAVPVVLVSSTSDIFRKQLESSGMNLNGNNSGNVSFELLESIHERKERERKKIVNATTKKSDRFFNNVLLSPGVRADLEALRRAQAFGESAGADVMVKVKKMRGGSEEDDKGKEQLPKAIRISGWDNVELFVEVYLNLLGDTMGSGDANAENEETIASLSFQTTISSNKRLPLLICPNGKDFGPFEHAASKRLHFFPSEATPPTNSAVEDKRSKQKLSSKYCNAMEVCGILLPCIVRKLLLVTRNRILEEKRMISNTKSSHALKGAESGNDDLDSSRYVVVHSTRPSMAIRQKDSSTSWIGGFNESLIFNQGQKSKLKTEGKYETSGRGHDPNDDKILECSYGKVVSMAVWDASREEVAACKMDSAFPAK